MVRNNPFKSASKISVELKESLDKSVSPDTVRKSIYRAAYCDRTARKKTYVSERNRKKRIYFAQYHKNNKNNFWDKMISSDESKYNIFGSDGRSLVSKKINEQLNLKNTHKTIEHGGGSIMVWGCMAADGDLEIIEGKMDKTVYLNIFKDNLKKSAEKLGICSDRIVPTG